MPASATKGPVRFVLPIFCLLGLIMVFGGYANVAGVVTKAFASSGSDPEVHMSRRSEYTQYAASLAGGTAVFMGQASIKSCSPLHLIAYAEFEVPENEEDQSAFVLLTAPCEVGTHGLVFSGRHGWVFLTSLIYDYELMEAR